MRELSKKSPYENKESLYENEKSLVENETEITVWEYRLAVRNIDWCSEPADWVVSGRPKPLAFSQDVRKLIETVHNLTEQMASARERQEKTNAEVSSVFGCFSKYVVFGGEFYVPNSFACKYAGNVVDEC